MFHTFPAIESRTGLETASERDSPQSRVQPEARDWAKDRANESAPNSERNATRNGENPAVAGVLRVELGGLEPPTSWVRSRRSLALNLPCLQRFSPVTVRSEARVFGSFPLESGQRDAVLARSRPMRTSL